MTITLDEILAPYTKTIELENSNSDDALLKVMNENLDIVTYITEQSFAVVNHGVLEKTNDGKYIARYELPYVCDMISDIHSNVPFRLYIGGQRVDNDSRPVMVALQYHRARIEFLLDPENLPKEYTLRYKGHIMSRELRRILAGKDSWFNDGNLVYGSGMCSTR